MRARDLRVYYWFFGTRPRGTSSPQPRTFILGLSIFNVRGQHKQLRQGETRLQTTEFNDDLMPRRHNWRQQTQSLCQTWRKPQKWFPGTAPCSTTLCAVFVLGLNQLHPRSFDSPEPLRVLVRGQAGSTQLTKRSSQSPVCACY